MPKDYARKPSARPVKPAPVKQRSSFSVFVMGAVFGAVLMHFTPVLLQKSPSPAAAVKEVGETIKAEASDLKFDFYTILKNSEIVVPSGGTEPGASAQPSDNATYLLQAGSFRLSSQAESLRVKLLLLNLNATVEAVGSSNGEKWYRVLVGPFTDASKMAYARTKLSENAIYSLLLKRKAE